MNPKYLLQPCTTENETTDAFRLRYRAYSTAGAIETNTTQQFTDKYDLQPNAKTGVVYEDDKAVAAIRACIYSSAYNWLPLPAFEVYRDAIEQELGRNKVIVEANRFVIDPAKMDSKQLFKIPFRFIIHHVLLSNSDFIITAVRPKHMPLYRRLLAMEPISSPKKYPGINVDMVLMAGECRSSLLTAMEKEALFRFPESEVAGFLTSADRLQLSYS